MREAFPAACKDGKVDRSTQTGPETSCMRDRSSSKICASHGGAGTCRVRVNDSLFARANVQFLAARPKAAQIQGHRRRPEQLAGCRAGGEDSPRRFARRSAARPGRGARLVFGLQAKHGTGSSHVRHRAAQSRADTPDGGLRQLRGSREARTAGTWDMRASARMRGTWWQRPWWPWLARTESCVQSS
jgi:hypothetical protein